MNPHDLEERLDLIDHHNRRNNPGQSVDWWYVGAWCVWIVSAVAGVVLWCFAYWKC